MFRSRSNLTYHVKRDHQSSVKMKFENESVTEVTKEADETFKCKCEKTFKLSITLRRHAKSCNDELMKLESKTQLMNDASKSMNFNDEMIDETSADCFDTLFSHEMG